MKIYFCDECHESIPLKDIADNTITIEGGKIYHERCRPRAAKPGGRVSYATAVVSLLLGLGLGAVVMAVWGDAILGRAEKESIASQISRIETTVMDLRNNTEKRLGAIERDMEVSAGVDGRAGKLARVFQGLQDNRDAMGKLRLRLDGIVDEIRKEQEGFGERFDTFQSTMTGQFKNQVDVIQDQVRPRLDDLAEELKAVQEGMAALKGRLDKAEKSLAARGTVSPAVATSRVPKVDVALDPEKARRRRELLAQLKSREGPKRFAAAVDLAEFPDAEVGRAMVALLKDPADYVRTTALTNLMDMKARWSIPHIIPVLRSEDFVLRETAIAALEKLMGESIGLDPDASSAKVLAKIRELNTWWDEHKDEIAAAE